MRDILAANAWSRTPARLPHCPITLMAASGSVTIMRRDDKPKDPAAVALGRRRQAAVTPDERAAFGKLGADASADANKRRTPEERRRIARRAALTRRMQPTWMAEMERRRRAADPPGGLSVATPPPVPVADPPLETDALADLARMIDDLSDEALTAAAAALAAQLPQD